MKFKTDENLPIEAAEALRLAGHDALSSVEQRLHGILDADLAAVCKTEARVLVTIDADFADIRTYPPHEYSGFIVLRLHSQSKPEVLRMVGRIIRALEENACHHQLWIVEEDRIRIRGGITER